ncbi:MAG: coagulation factor 5/8 type domain protein [Candidatus Eremiobacteraeota bacterium]|nr:coagulation factor 5/8 type domain protein [Candidatus Eremiobacteraeota bacterium]
MAQIFPEFRRGGKYRSRAAAGMERLYHRCYYDADTGLWRSPTAWWQSANAVETTVDYTAPSGAVAYWHFVENTFAKNSGGFISNDYYDDEGWWALAWLKAFDFSNDGRYLDAAQIIFDDMIDGWDARCGGGIWWTKGDKPSPDGRPRQKNAIANELFFTIAAKLHVRVAADRGAGSYLDWAQRAWSWFAGSGLVNAEGLINDGLTLDCRNDGCPTWTYIQGVILGGLVALYQATGEDALLMQAGSIADAAIQLLTDEDGVLRGPPDNDEVLGVDGPQFKGIFVRNLCELYDVTQNPAYRDFILNNANSIWTWNRGLSFSFGGYWSGPFDRDDGARQGSAMDALNAALLFDTAGTTAYQAEEASIRGLITESLHSGFHGTGYLAGWIHGGQAVTFDVTASSSGRFDIVLRYATVAGARRRIRLNGAVLELWHEFPATGSWSAWRTTTVYDVPLDAGLNQISISFETSPQSIGWLNLDELCIQ